MFSIFTSVPKHVPVSSSFVFAGRKKFFQALLSTFAREKTNPIRLPPQNKKKRKKKKNKKKKEKTIAMRKLLGVLIPWLLVVIVGMMMFFPGSNGDPCEDGLRMFLFSRKHLSSLFRSKKSLFHLSLSSTFFPDFLTIFFSQ